MSAVISNHSYSRYWAIHRASRAADKFGTIALHHMDRDYEEAFDYALKDLREALDALDKVTA